MDKTRPIRHIQLAVLFGAFTALVAMVVQIVALALMGTSVTAETLISGAVSGACIFVVSFLTVLFVWPRIGFDPFASHTHELT
jgi:hypothetical protein